MEQKDYLLREIEKIGVIINAMRQKIFGDKGNLSSSLEQQIENEKERLSKEINFDIHSFLKMSKDESNAYILGIDGFNVENIELLAECISELGFSDNCTDSKNYLEKALQLYELCNLQTDTYSIKRETNIIAINNFLKSN